MSVAVPWYPDGSGQWIERQPGDGAPPGIGPDDYCYILYGAQREQRIYQAWPMPMDLVKWDSEFFQGIVAYRRIGSYDPSSAVQYHRDTAAISTLMKLGYEWRGGMLWEKKE